jgi:hypothetical protein
LHEIFHRTRGRFAPWDLDELEPMQRAFVEESVLFRIEQETELYEALGGNR